MPAHRKETPPRFRPRVRRIAAASVSTLITTVALLGAVGVIPLGGAGSAAGNESRAESVAKQIRGIGSPQDSAATGTGSPRRESSSTVTPGSADSGAPAGTSPKATALPHASGSGKRVVFSQKEQRVWLVNAQGRPVATYLVSGSVTDNLDPGSYQVYSRSRWAVGVDDSGVMQYFVRFAHGANAAIGFHSIPSKLGKPLQKVSELGTPQSHGCIRQKLSDAERMWNFAKDGTAVVVVS